MISQLVPRLARRRLLTCVIVCVAAAAVVLVVLAGFALWRRAGRPAPVSELRHSHGVNSVTPVTHRPSPTSTPPGSVGLPSLPRTDDPVAYAREVAVALFGVSPASVSRGEFLQFWTGELPTVVYTDAASKGLTLAAQNADAIDTLTRWWIPPAAAWASEAVEHTVNRFAVTSVSVPDYWVNAVADGTFRDPGLHMERVMGVLAQSYGPDPLHRETASRSVVIDLGVLCGPTQVGGCRLVAPQPPPDLGND